MEVAIGRAVGGNMFGTSVGTHLGTLLRRWCHILTGANVDFAIEGTVYGGYGGHPQGDDWSGGLTALCTIGAFSKLATQLDEPLHEWLAKRARIRSPVMDEPLSHGETTTTGDVDLTDVPCARAAEKFSPQRALRWLQG